MRQTDLQRARAAARGNGRAAVTQPARVLIADDHAPTRAVLRAAVQQSGRFSVCAEVADGPAAVQAAVRELPDLCLLDAGMPGGGIAATREITSRLPETKVVIVTAFVEGDDFLQALAAGAVGYLPKAAVAADRLGRALEAVLRGEAAIPRALVTRLAGEFRDHWPRRRTVVSEAGHDLTSREWEVLDLLRQGLSTREISERLFVSRATVRSHAAAILRKLQLPDREALRMLGEG